MKKDLGGLGCEQNRKAEAPAQGCASTCNLQPKLRDENEMASRKDRNSCGYGRFVCNQLTRSSYPHESQHRPRVFAIVESKRSTAFLPALKQHERARALQ